MYYSWVHIEMVLKIKKLNILQITISINKFVTMHLLKTQHFTILMHF